MGNDPYVELVLHGPANQAVGFVEGFRIATGCSGGVWFAGREGVKLRDFMEKVKQRLHLVTHVILRSSLADAIGRAIESTPLVELTVESVAEIDYAEMSFSFCCYSRDVAAGARRVIEDHLPADVRLEGYELHEDVDEDSRGPELYTPRHDYILSGEGRYVGAMAGIIDLAHRLAEQDFIRPGEIRLHHPL